VTYRTLIFAGFMLVVSGCSSQKPTASTSCPQTEAVVLLDPSDYAITASALVFDAPRYAQDVAPDLSRESREPSAFVAYEGQTTSFSYIRLDDRQIARDGSWLRRAVTDRFTSSTR